MGREMGFACDSGCGGAPLLLLPVRGTTCPVSAALVAELLLLLGCDGGCCVVGGEVTEDVSYRRRLVGAYAAALEEEKCVPRSSSISF